jgi:hypothetical protein
MRVLTQAVLAGLLAAAVAPAFAADSQPSRPAFKGCAWEHLSDPAAGVAAWVQRCDYGFRKIDLFLQGRSILVRFSDGGAPEPVVDVFDLQAGESAEAGIKRVFDAHTAPELARRCVVAPYKGTAKAPAGVKRYSVVPDAAYAKEWKARQDPNEVGDPPCGDMGDSPDGIQYFEAQPKSGVRRFLLVRVGQDEPLFDENTLQLIPQP